MNLSRERMLDRAKARDRRYDGRFLTGVTSTGIYCLPSCPARQPRDSNVEHFADPAAARAAGLRPCKRCRPDEFYRGRDPDLELAVAAAGAMRRGSVQSVAQAARELGIGTTKLTELFRHYYHASPAAYLAAGRHERACELLRESDRRVLDIALAVGCESLSAFHESFRRHAGLAPSEFRALREATRFVLALPAGWNRTAFLAHLGRDRDSACERVEDNALVKTLVAAGVPLRLDVELQARRAVCRVESATGAVLAPDAVFAAHGAVVRLLSLRQGASGFERHVAALGLARLTRGGRGTRVWLTADPFEALVWSIVGQQVHLQFAFALRRRLVERCGLPLGRMFAHPTPEQVADLEPADLRAMQFSQRKAEYLIGCARRIARGEFDLDGLGELPVPALRAALAAQRGLGPWSAEYVAMRGFGRSDCGLPGDVAVRAGLQSLFELPRRPTQVEAEAWMRTFSPWRSLAVVHLCRQPRVPS
ncbi:MAG: DNA-3-methyladenine glycosylase 2 family protein [Planctomycetes bacterium]|nr:DNA-3-methyladenine glycosylase 2 family protein [Planctomycetota bacterium]